MRRCAPLLLLLLAGCGAKRSEADIERGRVAVVAALDSWKAGEPLTKLKALPDPVEFADDLRATHALVEYTIGKVDATDKDVIRVTVAQKVKDKKGTVTEREVVYSVALKSPVAVARDPYY